MRNHFVKALFGRGWESMGEAKYSPSTPTYIGYAMQVQICDKKCIFYDRKSFKEKEHDTMKAKGKITKNNIP